MPACTLLRSSSRISAVDPGPIPARAVGNTPDLRRIKRHARCLKHVEYYKRRLLSYSTERARGGAARSWGNSASEGRAEGRNYFPEGLRAFRKGLWLADVTFIALRF